MNKNILIVGLGLIGGSLALGLKRKEDLTIVGYDTNIQSLHTAKKLGVIDEIASNVEEAAKQADIIIFATPVSITIELMKLLPSWHIKDNVIVTDTGSTKSEIMNAALSLKANGITFIGGHPMAGSHKSGIGAARAHLFENAYYLITPFEDEVKENIETLKEILRVTKAKLVEISALDHDHMTATVSHFPHLIAASLVHQLSEENKIFPFTKQLAAGGFRDITRIASSNPVMWRDITMQNRQEISNQLQTWTEEMLRLKQLLDNADENDIEEYFAQAKLIRDQLPIAQGALYTVYDLYVDVPDYPGVIAEVIGYLAKEHISITNLRIVETREDVFGILVISFQTMEDRAQAVRCIAAHTSFETYIA